MKLPELSISNLKPAIPIIQGGMAIRISTSRLAAAVANEGGIGLIAGSGMSPQELKEEIKSARSLSQGIIGVNIMYAVSAFAELVKTAIEEKIDLIVSGAGFSRDMFGWGKEAGVPVVPIVGTDKLAAISQKLGASAVIVEGKEAGGHLGTSESVKELLPKVKKAVSIPVIAAGGIVDGKDMAEMIKLGADGVQIGIRFAASEESNADTRLKEAYVKAKDEDIILINSPVGLPGRAIRNEFTEKLSQGLTLFPKSCVKCLKECAKNFCIMEALQNAQQGKLAEGLIFSGEYIGKIKEILPVREIIRNLLREAAECV
ncbi:MAG: nitronate monooxygenase [Peptococcaceae bacterium]|nr:nitronate monooxygenase [Peptococcaceae bacterium]MDH7525464.1 nitronate monooxygenase [Peptococcaceae bacterium]